MYFKPYLLLVRTMLNYVHTYDSIVYMYVYTHASAAMPTTHRTNDYTTPSLALTNGSTFGDLLLSPGCPHLPEIQNTFVL